MIQAVVFDCFGVLTIDIWLAFRAKHFADNPELDAQAVDLNKQTDAGLISFETFVREVSKLTGLPETTAAQELASAPETVNTALFDQIRFLKQSYKIGLLSNAADNWLVELFGEANAHLFDAVALSYETGYVKPNPTAYKLIAERLGVEPSACVFIDDQERYCNGAMDVGMQAIHYVDNKQLLQDLQQVLH